MHKDYNGRWIFVLWRKAKFLPIPRFLRFPRNRPGKEKVVLLVIYLFNYDPSKSTFFMLNMAFDVVLSAVFIK